MQVGFRNKIVSDEFIQSTCLITNKAWILLYVTPLQVLIMPLQSVQQMQISTRAEESYGKQCDFWCLEDFITTQFFLHLNSLKLKFVVNVVSLINVWAAD